MRKLPTGTVTLLFTDIEHSTRLLHELGERYADVLAEHRRVLRDAFSRHGGVEVDTQGDAFFVAFVRASDAVAAAAEAQHALANMPVRVRVGIHTGEPVVTAEGYVGIDVHRAARISEAGHGGQILLSETTRQLLDSTFELRELGEHRLQDLSAPQRLYQLGDTDFPPLRTLYWTNLPIQPTPLVGRQCELAEAGALLQSHRLITLTGPGGSGKTRLALQLAAEAAEDFPDGIFWVPLQTLRAHGLVLPTIAQAVGAKDDLTSHLRSKQLLLVIDNFEQLLESAAALAGLLASGPKLKLLITSREPLHVAGEQEYEVPPLPEADAVVLFTERARSVMPDFEPDEHVLDICRRLDGLPLAIELAAARIKILSSSTILQRLDKRLEFLTGVARDAPERQRTLRATTEWSYGLLSDTEKEVFARLAAFAGGCTLAAADEVCAADVETLHSLVDKSLLRAQGGRFTMLETIQEYALERLEKSGDAEELRRRHAHHFKTVAERAEPELDAPDPVEWLNRLADEIANFRGALAWSAASGDTEVHIRLATSLHRFWLARGDVSEGRAWLEGVLARLPQHTELRAKALQGAMELVRVQGDHQRAKELAEERLALSRELNDPNAVASSLHDLGLLAADEGDHERAGALYQEAVDLGRRLGHKRVALWLTDLGSLARWQGELERASALLEEALAIHRQSEDRAGIAYALDELAIVALHQGRAGEARALLADGLRNWRAVGATNLIVVSLDTHAAAIAAQGEGERAARLLGAAYALREAMAIRPLYHEKSASPGRLAAATARAQLGEESFAAAFARGRVMSLEQAVADALQDTATTGRHAAGEAVLQ